VASRTVVAYEALLRSSERTLPTPPAVLAAAHKLGRNSDVARKVFALSARAFAAAHPDTLLFVNVQPSDLRDARWFQEEEPLPRIAGRVVLEMTERASMSEVTDLRQRVAVLRFMGFRMAVDDLGAGYAGLSSFAQLEPEFVKIDMSLVRDIHLSPVRQRLVRAMTSVSVDLGMKVIAEGVEVAEERDTLVSLGCPLQQGYLFAKPGPPFPSPVWG
jgi:EAL domain-containing protein (putative c-di-GMP-specific phosphodiesterase class I)